MHLITLSRITQALQEALQTDKTTASKYAMQLLDLFGYEDRIIDNILEQPDRQLFYLLEARGIVETKREEITLYNGKKWRIRYWALRKKMIERFIAQYHATLSFQMGKDPHQLACEAIYGKLSPEMWTSRRSNTYSSDS